MLLTVAYTLYCHTTPTGRSGGVILKQLDRAAAVQARDACAKALYEAVFLWVVHTVSTSLSTGDAPIGESLPFIGVLDIFGFENFARNELEQLLINYTNESLQDAFNKQVCMLGTLYVNSAQRSVCKQAGAASVQRRSSSACMQ
jgi:myosin heavy subunit